MLAVRDLVEEERGLVEDERGLVEDGHATPGVPAPRTEVSRLGSRAAVIDAHMALRSSAEQLVGEANAVLREQGRVIDLADEWGPGGLAFTLTYGHRSARVETVDCGGRAFNRLDYPGIAGDHTYQLADADEMARLVINLLSDTQRASDTEHS